MTAKLGDIVPTVRMAANTDPPAVAVARRPQFWLAPLLAGCCFSLGYGITHRLMAMQSAVRPVQPEGFSKRPFPGSSLDNLRSRNGDRAPLQVDLAAIDALNPPSKDAKPETTPRPQADGSPALALQSSPAEVLDLPEADEPVLGSGRTLNGEPREAPVVVPAPSIERMVEAPWRGELVPQPLLVPSLDAAAPFAPEPTDEFFLPVIPQAPPPPTP